MKPIRGGRTRIVSGALLGFALISVTATAQTGNALSDSEQLIADEKAWAKAAQDSDAERMASYMAEEYVEHVWETAHPRSRHGGVLADRHEEWERHFGERDLREHLAEAQRPLASDRQRVSLSGS
jgi:hypothetical protein